MTQVRRVGAIVPALAVALAAVGAAGCGVGDDEEGRPVLTVFAAASLTGAFSEIAAGFEESNPGVAVRLSFDGSSGLVDQIAGGAPADVLATADERTMARAEDAGLVTGEARVVATNHLVVVTPPGNPADVTGLDASLDGVRLVVCADAVPCGSATRALAATSAVALAPVSEETSVTDVRGKVESGEADAGIVYSTDAAAAGERVQTVPIAGADALPNRYPLAVVERPEHSDRPELADFAARFVDAVTGPDGQAVLARAGFGPA